MKAVLISPPDDLDAWLGRAQTLVQKYEPLGLLYLAAYALRGGHDLSVIDCRAEGIGEADLKSRLLRLAPDVVGISTLTSGGEFVYHFGRWLKTALPKTTVVLGNVHAAVFDRDYLLNGCCDAVVRGEGERPFLEILDRLRDGKGFDGIEGVSFLKGSEVERCGDNAVFPDLCALPLPARELLDRKNYYLTALSNQSYIPRRGATVKTMSTSRGCLFDCVFCGNRRALRLNSPRAVADEMELLEKEYGADYICIVDPLFVADKERVLAICEEIKKRGLKARWNCESHVNCVSKELIKAMDGANCHEICLGLESGVQRLLDGVRKGVKLSEVPGKVRLIRENSSMNVNGLFILGLPGETYADSLETISFAKRLDLDVVQFSVLSPYPGSPLFKELAAAGKLNTGVLPGDKLDPAVWRRYSAYTAFSDEEPVWVTPALTSAQLKHLQKKAYRDFYLRPSQIWKNLPRLFRANPFEVLKTVWDFLF